MGTFFITLAIIFYLPSAALASEKAGVATAQYMGRSCAGPLENDEMVTFCQAQGSSQIYEVGTRYEYESFETISKALTPAIEAGYDMILLVNSIEGGLDSTSNTAFIPNQHMLIVQKPSGQKKMFTRDSRGVIKGLAPGVKILRDIIGTQPWQDVSDINAKLGKRADAGMPIEWDGMDVVPVSTGKPGKMKAFSGIFQVNWDLSRARYDSSIYAPMSQEMYLGYYYHGRGTPRNKWKDSNRERESWAAVHGTPPQNWNLLGKKRASGGCARTHPMIQKHIRKTAINLPFKNIYNLDWNFNLGEQNPKIPYAPASPVLIIVFDSYETQGA